VAHMGPPALAWS